jgi:hypothetical protein
MHVKAGLLFVPESAKSKWKRERHEARLRRVYYLNWHVKHLADSIHSSRMMAPPACDQCIQIAIRQLNNDSKLRAKYGC